MELSRRRRRRRTPSPPDQPTTRRACTASEPATESLKSTLPHEGAELPSVPIVTARIASVLLRRYREKINAAPSMARALLRLSAWCGHAAVITPFALPHAEISAPSCLASCCPALQPLLNKTQDRA